MKLIERVWFIIAFGGLLLIQWPFKAISDALDRPIDKMHERAEQILEKKS